LWERLAVLVHDLGQRAPAGAGPRATLSDVGAVLGATAPLLLARARELMPDAVFLLPGIGAQGARIEQLGAALAPLETSARRASALFTAARSVAGAHSASGSEPTHAARAEAERLRADAWELA
jgi:orotidine-5'-phosphate decarboxylase